MSANVSTHRTAERLAEAAADLELADLRTFVSTAAGRRFLWALISRTGVFASAFDTEALRMAFIEGRRSVGVDLLQMLQVKVPEGYLAMVQEAAKAVAEASALVDASEAVRADP